MTETSSFRTTTNVPDDPVAAPDGARDDTIAWTSGLALGTTSVLFGVAVLAWPDATLRVAAVLIGLWLLVAGITQIVTAVLSGEGARGQVLSVIVGVLFVVAGVACLRDLVTALVLLAFIVALRWILGGLATTVLAFQAIGASRIGLLAVGIVSVAIGIAFLAIPKLSLTALLILAAVGALVAGVGEIVVALRVRRAGRNVRPRRA